jgi:alpha 1,3-glucosidase
VAPDKEGKASGTLYLDDGKSFAYQEGAKLYMQFTWDNGKMESKMISPPGMLDGAWSDDDDNDNISGMSTPVWLERVLVLGSAPPPGQVATVSSPSGTSSAQASYDYTTQVLTVRRPGVKLDMEWTIRV